MFAFIVIIALICHGQYGLAFIAFLLALLLED